MFLFFSRTRCLTEAVSSWSNTYYCWSLSDDRCLFPVLLNAWVSASGLILPPHIIFQHSFPSGPYGRDRPEGALYSVSPNGYMDSELFYGFLDKLFIPQTQNIQGPKLLILHGHGSHLSIDSINLCRRKNIHMYCLPPHTPVFQPLDVVIFHPLKAHFNRINQNLKLATLGWKESINCCKTNFMKLFKQLWESMTVTLIKQVSESVAYFPWTGVQLTQVNYLVIP